MDIKFTKVKKVEIIIKGEKQKTIEVILKKSGIKGFTIIRDVAGMGSHGYHESHLLFNEMDTYIMYVAIASEQSVNLVAQGLLPILEEESGVLFVSDTSVIRNRKFSG